MDLLDRGLGRRRHLLCYHVILDDRVEFSDTRMILIEDLARIHVGDLKAAQPLKGAPYSRILIKRLLIQVYCLSALQLSFIDLPEKVEPSSAIRDLTQLICVLFMLLEGSRLLPVQKGFLSFLQLIKLDAGQCELVPIRVLCAVFQDLISFVSFSLSYTIIKIKQGYQCSIQQGEASHPRS